MLDLQSKFALVFSARKGIQGSVSFLYKVKEGKYCLRYSRKISSQVTHKVLYPADFLMGGCMSSSPSTAWSQHLHSREGVSEPTGRQALLTFVTRNSSEWVAASKQNNTDFNHFFCTLSSCIVCYAAPSCCHWTWRHVDMTTCYLGQNNKMVRNEKCYFYVSAKHMSIYYQQLLCWSKNGIPVSQKIWM